MTEQEAILDLASANLEIVSSCLLLVGQCWDQGPVTIRAHAAEGQRSDSGLVLSKVSVA